MEQTFSSTVFLVIGVIAAVVFVVLFIYTAVSVSKGRAAVRKRLENACAFASVINADETKDFYYLDSSLADADGKEVKVPDEVGGYKLLFSGFACGSQMPERCCRVAVENVEMEHDELGRCFGGEPVVFSLRPAANIVSKWTIVSVSESHVVCEHPIMGKLSLPKQNCPAAAPGGTLSLISIVKKAPAAWLLQYRVLA